MNIKYLFYALRPKQWIKNFFIFIPLIFGKKLFIFPDNAKTFLAFCLFSGAASVVYLVNDLIDFKRDRYHPTKRLRPIPSGKISTNQARLTILILSPLVMSLSFALDVPFGCVVAAYFAFNFIYSKLLKNFVVIDVFCLSGFFLLRLLAGGLVSQIHLSHWVVIMTALLALFLGFSKRRQEILLLRTRALEHRSVLTQYKIPFIDQMVTITTASLVVAYMLYTVDLRTLREFGTNNLMLSIPFVYYGIFRYLYQLYRVKNDGDPTRVLLSDRMLQVDLFLWFIVCVGVIYFGL